MKLPDLDTSSAHLGDWIDLADVEALIPSISLRYHLRYAQDYYGDQDDLEQVARIAMWQLMQGQGHQDRVRQLLAFSTIDGAIRDEVESTKRTGPHMLGSQEINWRVLTTVDRNLNEDQKWTLFLFRDRAAQIVGKPYWEWVWLILGLGWSVDDVRQYLRRKKDERQNWRPEVIRKTVLKAEGWVRAALPRWHIEEVNHISLAWW